MTFDIATMTLLNALFRALYFDCNAAEVHAPQSSTWGELAWVLRRAIARSFLNSSFCGSDEADRIAAAIFDSMMDNGEDFTYNLALFDEGLISY